MIENTIAEIMGNTVIVNTPKETKIYGAGDEVTKVISHDGQIYAGKKDGGVEILGNCFTSGAPGSNWNVTALHIGTFLYVGYKVGFGIKYDLEGKKIHGGNIADGYYQEDGIRKDDYYMSFLEHQGRLFAGTRLGKFRSAPVEDIRRRNWENHQKEGVPIQRILEHEDTLYFASGKVKSYKGEIASHMKARDMAIVGGKIYVATNDCVKIDEAEILFPAKQLEKVMHNGEPAVLAISDGQGIVIKGSKIVEERKFRGKVTIL